MDTNRKLTPAAENPYVGPRPFELEEEGRFFGRTRESRDLLSLVLSERLVVFYAQSGAGKTSLINTRLKPGLEAAGFEVPQVGRVSGEFPTALKLANIFATNLMLKLDEGVDDPARFAGLRLSDFLLNLAKDGKAFYYRPPAASGPLKVEAEPAPEVNTTGEEAAEAQLFPRALIIDQFEELFTTHPEAWKQRKDFFQQLAEAMEADPYLWVVLAMREDHIAELDRYADLFPNGFRTRYYMQRMGDKAAFEAVTKPVEKLRPFNDECARQLVENLSQVSAGMDEKGQPRFEAGEFIEPVQLQVVCYQLWENLKDKPGEQITLDDLQRMAHGQDLAKFVNQALGDYYQDTLRKALGQPGNWVSEGKLRDWFGTKLITEARTRGFVFMGERLTAGIPNPVVRLMEGKLVRGDSRAGGRWYELVHDRFIDPILQANRRWGQVRQRKFLLWGGLAFIVVSLFLSFYFSVIFVPASLQGRETQVSQKFEGTVEVVQQNVAAAQVTVAIAQRTATSAANDLVTANARATQANSALSVVQNAREQLFSTQAKAASTFESFAAEASRVALENQLSTLQPINRTASPTPTPGSSGGGGETPTPTPTQRLQATHEAATAGALQALIGDLHATQTALANPIRELIIGQSVKGAPIRVEQFGNGTRNVIVVGGMHSGSAPSTVTLAGQIADYFTKNLRAIPSTVKLHVIGNASPDGIYAPGKLIGRGNANGVDINRNWDCDWKSQATWAGQTVSGGSGPFSEPETQALRDYFLRTQPVAVVIWEAMVPDGQATPGGCGMRSLFSEALAQIYGSAAGYNVAPFTAYAINGDASNWLDAQGIPAISVLLPDRVTIMDNDLQANLAAIFAVFASYGPQQ